MSVMSNNPTSDCETEISELRERLRQCDSERVALKQDASMLARENKTLREWVGNLLTYTGLQLEDIKAVCEQDKQRGEALTAVLGLARAIGGEREC